MEGDNYKAYICYAISLSEFGEYDMAVEMYKKQKKFNPKKLMRRYFLRTYIQTLTT